MKTRRLTPKQRQCLASAFVKIGYAIRARHVVRRPFIHNGETFEVHFDPFDKAVSVFNAAGSYLGSCRAYAESLSMGGFDASLPGVVRGVTAAFLFAHGAA